MAALADKVGEKFPEVAKNIKTFRDEITLTVRREDIINLAHFLKEDSTLSFDFLSDLCCVDYLGRIPRFEVVYNVYSIKNRNRVRIKVPLDEEEPLIDSVCPIWPAADWYEREAYDMFGIVFKGHPDLRRILMPSDWVGHPLRKDYPLRGEEVAFSHNWDTAGPLEGEMGIGDEYMEREVWLTPGPMETTLVKEVRPGEKGTIFLNMGPQHPSTHGLLRVLLELDGETVVKAIPHIGYLHTGIEKNMENLTYNQALTLTDRVDYLVPLLNNLAYCMAVEKLLAMEIPLRAQYIRVLLSELTRIASHLVWLSAQALDIGAISVFLYCFREREIIMDLFEMLSGVRMMTSFITIGGLRDELPEGWIERVGEFTKIFPGRVDVYEDLLTKNPIWEMRTKGIGAISADEAIGHGVSGPILRACGVKFDVRKANPYSSYEHFAFDIPVGSNGDVYDCYIVRMKEMRESIKIIKQALENLPDGPIKADDRKVLLPPKAEISTGMEALIHHFLLSSRGFPVPPGEAYAWVESARGELGYYVVSDGGTRPYRVKIRTPSFANLQALPKMVEGRFVADVVAVIGSIDPVLGDADR